MENWRLPWKYVMVMDFGPGEPTGYACAQCHRPAEQYAVLLTDADLKKAYFDLQCAARVLGPSEEPEAVEGRMAKLLELRNRGSVRVGPDLINP